MVSAGVHFFPNRSVPPVPPRPAGKASDAPPRPVRPRRRPRTRSRARSAKPDAAAARRRAARPAAPSGTIQAPEPSENPSRSSSVSSSAGAASSSLLLTPARRACASVSRPAGRARRSRTRTSLRESPRSASSRTISPSPAGSLVLRQRKTGSELSTTLKFSYFSGKAQRSSMCPRASSRGRAPLRPQPRRTRAPQKRARRGDRWPDTETGTTRS